GRSDPLGPDLRPAGLRPVPAHDARQRRARMPAVPRTGGNDGGDRAGAAALHGVVRRLPPGAAGPERLLRLSLLISSWTASLSRGIDARRRRPEGAKRWRMGWRGETS